MFSNVLQQATGLLERRFLLNAFFPSLIFWGLLIVVCFAGPSDLTSTAKSFREQEVTGQVFEIIIFIVWVTLFSNVMASQVNNILRFYEGYWNFPFSQFFHSKGQGSHQAQLQKVKSQLSSDPAAYEKIYLGYPWKSTEVMPTRLGNILKNAELYPKDRYKIDAVLIWPRLYNLLPEHFVQTIAEARSGLDFMLTISSLAGLFALLAGGYLLLVGAAWWLFLLCFWGGMTISYLAYKSALSNALLYAQQIKAAFDLYRKELFKQMNLVLPTTLDGEKKQWEELKRFLYQNKRQSAAFWFYTP